MKVWKRILALLFCLSLVASFSVSASAELEKYNYTARIFPGKEGVYTGGGEFQIETVQPGEQRTLTAAAFQMADSNSKYRIRGLRESGKDNRDTLYSSYTWVGDKDIDFVVAYYVPREEVKLTVLYLEYGTDRALAEPREFFGNRGERFIVGSEFVRGYDPAVLVNGQLRYGYNAAITLDQDYTLIFYYTPTVVATPTPANTGNNANANANADNNANANANAGNNANANANAGNNANANANAGNNANANANAGNNANANANAGNNANANANAGNNANANANAGENANANANAGDNANANANAGNNANANANAGDNVNAATEAYTDNNANTNAGANAGGNTNTDANAGANAGGNTNTDANAGANAGGNTNANANAGANAGDNANANAGGSAAGTPSAPEEIIDLDVPLADFNNESSGIGIFTPGSDASAISRPVLILGIVLLFALIALLLWFLLIHRRKESKDAE